MAHWRLGRRQAMMLALLKKHGHWSQASKWHIESNSVVIKMLGTLAGYGLVSLSAEGVYTLSADGARLVADIESVASMRKGNL